MTETEPCTSCNGTGEHVLLTSVQTCERCTGSKIEPATRDPNALAPPAVSHGQAAGGWVLVDSVEVAKAFVGRRVEIDAPAFGFSGGPHSLHGRQHVLVLCDCELLLFANSAISWHGRGNVRLRLAEEGDDA